MNWDPTLDPPTTTPHAASGWFDASRPHPARVYDYLLGGKDHFAADRRAADQISRQAPWMIAGARANRAFLRRAVTHLAKLGIDQYLDIGSGLPTTANVHQIAGRHRPGARIAYLDNDPIVLTHARALLACDRHTIAEHGDARDPHAILTNPAVRAHLDFTRPMAALFIAVLHFLTPEDDPASVVATVRDALAPGSFIVISHVADLPDQHQPAGRAEATRKAAQLYTDLTAPLTLRTPDQIADLFTGLDLLDPGLFFGFRVSHEPVGTGRHPTGDDPCAGGRVKAGGRALTRPPAHEGPPGSDDPGGVISPGVSLSRDTAQPWEEGLVGVHQWHPPRSRRPLPPVPVLAGIGALPPQPSASLNEKRPPQPLS